MASGGGEAGFGITVTGADERTPIRSLLHLTWLSPRVEIGLLWSETPEGRNRYPRREWLIETAQALKGRCAIHVCGRGARQVAMDAPLWMDAAARVQVNGPVTKEDLFELCRPMRFASVITQHNPRKNPDLSRLPRFEHHPRYASARHELLMDASGGMGRSPETWERADTWKPVGFAGGLGPDNLATELPRIAAVARGRWWIDMEGRIRDEGDWFSVCMAEQAIETALRFSERADALHPNGGTR